MLIRRLSRHELIVLCLVFSYKNVNRNFISQRFVCNPKWFVSTHSTRYLRPTRATFLSIITRNRTTLGRVLQGFVLTQRYDKLLINIALVGDTLHEE